MSRPTYSGKLFFYPCAGNDIVEPIQTFGEQYDTFLFVDINYRSGLTVPDVSGWLPVEGSHSRFGSPDSLVRIRQKGRNRYRVLESEWFLSDYVSEDTGRKIHLVRRRGFGQYALHELEDDSLSMFMHRGDSNGEGGSGVCYLANRHMDHEPISNLLDVIKRKLTKPGLIASDGSNTPIQELSAVAHGEDSLTCFSSHGLTWRRCAGSPAAIGTRRTTVWKVSPLLQQADVCSAYARHSHADPLTVGKGAALGLPNGK